MAISDLRDAFEGRQVWIYFAAVIIAAITGFVVPSTAALEPAINPALALMLFVTFLQVPVAALGRALKEVRFLGALLAVNFIAVPLLVAALIQVLPASPMLRLGVLMVLLCPCIDYVVTFSHLGRADARLLLASTPALLIVQMVLLPARRRDRVCKRRGGFAGTRLQGVAPLPARPTWPRPKLGGSRSEVRRGRSPKPGRGSGQTNALRRRSGRQQE